MLPANGKARTPQSRLPSALHWIHLWHVRTARLLRTWPMTKQSLCHSLQGRSASGSVTGKAFSGRAALTRGRRRERCRCANEYDPGVAATGKMPVYLSQSLSPMAPGQWIHDSLALGSCALQNGLHAGREQAIGCAFGEGPSAWKNLWTKPLECRGRAPRARRKRQRAAHVCAALSISFRFVRKFFAKP